GFGRFLMLQAATISPLLLLTCVLAVAECWRRGLRRGDDSSLFLACTSTVTIGFFGLYAFVGQVELYWTLGGYLPAFVAAASCLLRPPIALWPRHTRMTVLGLILAPGLLVTLLI